MIIGGSAYNELLHDNYRPRGGKGVKMTKEEAEAYDKDPNITIMFADSDSDSDSEYVDIDIFEYEKNGHTIIPF